MGIGCYPIQAALIAFDHEEPVAVVSAGHTQDYQGGKTDIMATIILLFKNNRMAVLNCLGQQISEINSLTIYGTEGKKVLFISIIDISPLILLYE